MSQLPANNGLTKAQRIGLWGGVAGGAVGCTAWLLAMAGLAGDWPTVAITLLLDLAVVYFVAQWCIRYPAKRFLLLGLMLVVLSVHCLAVYWWRLEVWRSSMQQPVEDLFRQKRTVTIAVSAMVAILLGQMMMMHWLQKRARPSLRR